jgi:catechol 2,3-dioxygenase-like lactoylglutathione lyase family enzyme
MASTRAWQGRADAVRQEIAAVALVVRDYDEALAYFTGSLGFAVVEDTPLESGKRWVAVRPRGGGTSLVLARAVTPEQAARVGDQTGGRVFLFLRTDDFWRDYQDFRSRGVQFAEQPREEEFGIVAVFLDLYGNRWDLIQPRPGEPGAESGDAVLRPCCRAVLPGRGC